MVKRQEMDFLDYYKVLGIAKKASQDDIKKAYRKLARKYHPDVNPNDKASEKKFKEINEAHEVLSHPENRKKYDQYGKDWKHADAYDEARKQQAGRGGGRGHFTYDHGQGDFGGGDFSDFFESIFGQSGGFSSRQSRSMKGQDLTTETTISLKDAHVDHKRVLNVQGKKLRITIPAGIKDGQTIRLRGQGGPGAGGGNKGDLYITFHFKKDKSFERKGNNLYLEYEVNLYTMLLGGKIEIPTMGGNVQVTLKPETPNGHQIRLKGKGYPVYKKKNMYGDLYVKIHANIPAKLTKKEKELFGQLQSLRS